VAEISVETPITVEIPIMVEILLVEIQNLVEALVVALAETLTGYRNSLRVTQIVTATTAIAMALTTANLETITTRVTTKGLTTITITIILETILKADTRTFPEGTIAIGVTDVTGAAHHLIEKGQEEMTPKKSGRPEKKAKKPAELPKPTQSVKILAQLKECPFGVNVYQSQNKKLPITEKEFTEIMSNVNQKWMDVMDTSEEKLKIDGSEWYKNRGIILCKDEFTRKWITESIEGVQIGGRQFKAWGVGEAGDVVDVTVLLGSVLDSCPDPKDVIMKALKNSEVEYEKVEVVNVNKTEKGRMVNLLMDGKCVNTLKFKKNGKIFAGLAELKFEF